MRYEKRSDPELKNSPILDDAEFDKAGRLA